MLNRMSNGPVCGLGRIASQLALAVLAIAILSLSSITFAAERGRVVGSVTDPNGGKVAGARVALRDASGAVVYQTRTDADGQFSILSIAEGHYRVAVEAAGFSQPQPASVEVRASGGHTIVAPRPDAPAPPPPPPITPPPP